MPIRPCYSNCVVALWLNFNRIYLRIYLINLEWLLFSCEMSTFGAFAFWSKLNWFDLFLLILLFNNDKPLFSAIECSTSIFRFLYFFFNKFADCVICFFNWAICWRIDNIWASYLCIFINLGSLWNLKCILNNDIFTSIPSCSIIAFL